MTMNRKPMFGSKSQQTLTKYSALPLRLIVGYGFLEHGMAKWSKGPDTFAAILNTIGVPAPLLIAYPPIGPEILRGIAVLLGPFVWLASIPAVILLVVAIVTVHLPYGFSSI